MLWTGCEGTSPANVPGVVLGAGGGGSASAQAAAKAPKAMTLSQVRVTSVSPADQSTVFRIEYSSAARTAKAGEQICAVVDLHRECRQGVFASRITRSVPTATEVRAIRLRRLSIE
jgi:hypothetical protein